MLINDLMPIFDLSETEQIKVAASREAVFRAVKTFDISNSTTIRWLFKMRGISIENLTLRDLEKINIKTLAEKPGEEIVLGLVGEFRTLTGNLLELTAADFADFKQPGFIKIAWNFFVDEKVQIEVLSEARVHATNEKSLEKVKKYWTLIKPPSAMFRQEILKLIKREAEEAEKVE